MRISRASRTDPRIRWLEALYISQQTLRDAEGTRRMRPSKNHTTGTPRKCEDPLSWWVSGDRRIRGVPRWYSSFVRTVNFSNIAGGAHVGNADLDVGAGDQRIMLESARGGTIV